MSMLNMMKGPKLEGNVCKSLLVCSYVCKVTSISPWTSCQIVCARLQTVVCSVAFVAKAVANVVCFHFHISDST